MTLAIEFDFQEKVDARIPLERIRPAIEAGRFV